MRGDGFRRWNDCAARVWCVGEGGDAERVNVLCSMALHGPVARDGGAQAARERSGLGPGPAPHPTGGGRDVSRRPGRV